MTWVLSRFLSPSVKGSISGYFLSVCPRTNAFQSPAVAFIHGQQKEIQETLFHFFIILSPFLSSRWRSGSRIAAWSGRGQKEASKMAAAAAVAATASSSSSNNSQQQQQWRLFFDGKNATRQSICQWNSPPLMEAVASILQYRHSLTRAHTYSQ